MKSWMGAVALALGMAATGLGLAQGSAQGSARGSAQGPEIKFEFSNPVRMPEGTYLGEAAGVATNSKGHIFVYTRANTARLYEFDRDGKFLKEIGKDVYGAKFAHTVRVDKEDNLWVTDEGSNEVMEFDPTGNHILRIYGRKPESVEGSSTFAPTDAVPLGNIFPNFSKSVFNRPTDVTWNGQGDLFVADGYNNSRVVKFDKDGAFSKAWGKRGTGPSEFHTVHSIASDAKGNVYVADRENNRIQVFDSDGTFQRVIAGVGAPWAVCITPGADQVLWTSDSDNGVFYKLALDGTVLGHFGKFGKLPGQFGWVHEISCSQPDTLYVAELLNWRVQKLVLKK